PHAILCLYTTRPPSLAPISFSNAPPPPVIYTLSLHDALPISWLKSVMSRASAGILARTARVASTSSQSVLRPSRSLTQDALGGRSEEHTSELQSRGHLVCRLLLEKKKKKNEKM